MKNPLKSITCIIFTILIALPVLADWDEGGPHKMHYPQLPDPNGWDINFSQYTLADDWLCTSTEPVGSIHFWYSWYHDLTSSIGVIHLSIHADDRRGPYSKPLNPPLWQTDVFPGQFVIRHYGEGVQGWFEPGDPPYIELTNHYQYYQVNVTNFGQMEPFLQEEGNIYWLDIRIPLRSQTNFIGWKTTTNHFEDDAVYWNEMAQPNDWYELIDPFTQESLDLAFVIGPIPEPSLFFIWYLSFIIYYQKIN